MYADCPLRLAVLLLVTGSVTALDCFQCIYVETGNDANLRDITMREDHEVSCETAPITSINHVTAPRCDGVCASASATFWFTNSSGDFPGRIVARDCVPIAEGDPSFAGCATNNATALPFLVPQFIYPLVYDVQVEQVCFCEMDFCSAGPCVGSHLKLFGYCVSYGVLVALILAALLALAIVTGFCCCCGCCCGKLCDRTKLEKV